MKTIYLVNKLLPALLFLVAFQHGQKANYRLGKLLQQPTVLLKYTTGSPSWKSIFHVMRKIRMQFSHMSRGYIKIESCLPRQ